MCLCMLRACSCAKVYSRHRNSIDPERHVCSKCKSRLAYLGKFSKTNKLLVSVGVKHNVRTWVSVEFACTWPCAHQTHK